MDALDGKQARRTGNSTPLGELFDHGCDAVTTSVCFFLSFIYFIYFPLFLFISTNFHLFLHIYLFLYILFLFFFFCLVGNFDCFFNNWIWYKFWSCFGNVVESYFVLLGSMGRISKWCFGIGLY